MTFNKNSLPYTILFTFILGALFVVPLALANEVTKPIVAFNSQLTKKYSILTSMGILVERSNSQLVNDTYEQKVQVTYLDKANNYASLNAEQIKAMQESGTNQLVEVYKGVSDKGETVYAKQFIGSGLWGAITTILSFNSDLSRLTGIAIVSHSETPGLGARIDESWYKTMVTGEAIVDGKITPSSVPINRENKDDGKIDVITGATRTSEGMGAIYNLAIKEMTIILPLIQGGQL